MKTKYYIFILSVCLIVLFCIFSCKKNLKDSSHSQDGFNHLTENNEIQIENVSYPVKNYSKYNRTNITSASNRSDRYDMIPQENADMTQEVLTNLLTNLKDHFSGDIKNLSGIPTDIFIYTKPSLNHIEYDKIEFFSIITRFEPENIRKHHFYKVLNGSTTINEVFTQDCSHILGFNFRFLAAEFGSESIGIMRFSSSASFNYTGPPINKFNSQVINSLNLDNGFLIVDKGCKGNCPVDNFGPPCVQCNSGGTNLGWVCGCPPGGPSSQGNNPTGGDELFAKINTVIKFYNLVQEPLNEEEIRSIRDNILKKYSYGQKYIDYHGKVSYMAGIFGFIDLYNIDESYNFAKQTQLVLKKFADPLSNEIPITAEYRDAAVKICAKYKELTTNTVYTEMLNTFENDIIRFHGKTVKQILAEIQ